MKAQSLFAVFVSSLMSFSASAAERFVCIEFNPSNDKLKQKTIVIEENLGDATAEKSHVLSLYQGAKPVAEWTTEGTLSIDDVAVDFVSQDGKTQFYTYLDEGDQSGLKISGQKKGSYICR